MIMKKVVLSLIACMAMFANVSHAENVTFTGTLANACTISGITGGSLTISGTSVSTDTLAQATVVNNSGGIFKLDYTDPSVWDSKPNSYSGTTTFDGGFTLVGDNAQGSLVKTLNLANTGTDTASVQIFGNSDSVYTGGNYAATAVISCNAI